MSVHADGRLTSLPQDDGGDEPEEDVDESKPVPTFQRFP
jgi:hypothetical protein